MSPPARSDTAGPAGEVVLRHSLGVRIAHWVNVLALAVMMMSGLAIFNAHPALDWGRSSYTGRPPFFEISARESPDGRLAGVTRVFSHEFDTTGVLGVSKSPDGGVSTIAFPSWATIPGRYSLADARTWHFFFAWVFVLNGLVYLLHAVFSGHLARDLWPTRDDMHGIGRSIVDHLALRHPTGDAARRYNVLQKLAYLAVVFVLLPAIVLAGWAMSPSLDTLWPGWVDLFGGRQSARSVHFFVAWLLVAFVVVHVAQVLIAGPWNHLRSMLSGRYRLPPEVPRHG